MKTWGAKQPFKGLRVLEPKNLCLVCAILLYVRINCFGGKYGKHKPIWKLKHRNTTKK